MKSRISGGMVMEVSKEGLWYKRLGHASEEKLRQIECFSKSIHSIESKLSGSCINAKKTHLPFPSSSIKMIDCFDLIHCDIQRSYRVPLTSRACCFFFTIFDDFSHVIWVYLFNHINEASEGLVNFYMIKTQFGKEIKILQSDNGGAFTSNFMQELYAKHCIIL